MKIAIGCDHGGLEHKDAIVAHLKERGFEVKDSGIYENHSVDYPDIAVKVCADITSGECERGILVCGTGIGMSLAANKVKGIRAAAVSEHFSAKYTRLHNNSNVLCLGARMIPFETALELTKVFLTTEFDGGRHERRVKMLDNLL